MQFTWMDRCRETFSFSFFKRQFNGFFHNDWLVTWQVSHMIRYLPSCFNGLIAQRKTNAASPNPNFVLDCIVLSSWKHERGRRHHFFNCAGHHISWNGSTQLRHLSPSLLCRFTTPHITRQKNRRKRMRHVSFFFPIWKDL